MERQRHSTVSPEDILQAKKRITPFIKATPLIFSHTLSGLLEAEVYLKPECFQVTGSFKVRGACNALGALKTGEGGKGVLTCSSGNHGAALSYAASMHGGIPVTVFMPEGAEEVKKARIRSYGASIRTSGKNFLEAYAAAMGYSEEKGIRYVHSHGDPLVIAGQGTIGLEILEEQPDIDDIIVPVGGGGLISGISTAVKSFRPEIRICGVEAAAAPGAYLSFRDGYCHETVDIRPSLADGLLGTLTPLTYAIASQFVESIHLAEEGDIARAVRAIFEAEQLVVEGSGAAGLAAAMTRRIDVRGRRVVFVLTGRNISPDTFLDAVGRRQP